MVTRLCFFLLLTTPALAAPTTHPLTPEAQKQQDEIDSSVEASKLPTLTAQSLKDTVKISVSADMLDITPTLSPPSTAEFHLTLPQPHVVATFRSLGSTRQPPSDEPGARSFTLIVRDFSQPGSDTPWTTVSAAAGHLQIVREIETDTPGGTRSGKVELIQDPPPPGSVNETEVPIRLTILRKCEPPLPTDIELKLNASTFSELRRKYPRELDEYLRPILLDFGGAAGVLSPDPASAWQVLANDWTQEPKLADRVGAIVMRLNADSFADRRAAMQELHALGEPAALTLMRANRAGWSIEQSNAVDTLLAPFLPLKSEDVKRLGSDPTFLLELQDSDDASLRLLAAARLAKQLGHPIDLDPAADAVHRAAEIAAIRSMIPPPTTAP